MKTLRVRWLNKCRCGVKDALVTTVKGSNSRLYEDDAVECFSCGRNGVVQTNEGFASVLWETDEERES